MLVSSERPYNIRKDLANGDPAKMKNVPGDTPSAKVGLVISSYLM